MKIVLNGGGTRMDSATIPIQWGFSEAVAKRKPTHLLIIEQTEYEAKCEEKTFRGDSGRRRIVPVSRVIEYLQIYSPGKHRIAVVALSNSQEENSYDPPEKQAAIFRQNLEGLLVTCRNSYEYRTSLTWRAILELANDDSKSEWICVGAAVAEIEVPENLFAKVSENPVMKFLYRCANRWCSKGPRDQCEYRKRLLFYALPKTLIWLIGWAFSLTVGTIVSAVAISLRLLVLYLGWRPAGILENISMFFSRPILDWTLGDMNINRGDNYKYRVWEVDTSYPYKVQATMPVTGIEATLILLAGLISWNILRNVEMSHVTRSFNLSFATIFVVAFLAIMIWRFVPVMPGWDKLGRWYRKYRQDRLTIKTLQKEQKKKAAQEAAKMELAKPDPYTNWLMKEMSLKSVPAKVDTSHLPKPLTITGQASKVVRVTFWGAKTRVCKPYAR